MLHDGQTDGRSDIEVGAPHKKKIQHRCFLANIVKLLGICRLLFNEKHSMEWFLQMVSILTGLDRFLSAT